MAKNPLTDPGGAIGEGQFPPNSADAKGTTHKDAKKQDAGKDHRGAGKDANDVQPGLKGKDGAGFTEKPFAGDGKNEPAIHGGAKGGPVGGGTPPAGG
jgi:hypothetical protein